MFQYFLILISIIFLASPYDVVKYLFSAPLVLLLKNFVKFLFLFAGILQDYPWTFLRVIFSAIMFIGQRWQCCIVSSTEKWIFLEIHHKHYQYITFYIFHPNFVLLSHFWTQSVIPLFLVFASYLENWSGSSCHKLWKRVGGHRCHLLVVHLRYCFLCH